MEAASTFWSVAGPATPVTLALLTPDADKRVPGYVEGYVRRFWQVSEPRVPIRRRRSRR